jgi:hypothetical protein
MGACAPQNFADCASRLLTDRILFVLAYLGGRRLSGMPRLQPAHEIVDLALSMGRRQRKENGAKRGPSDTQDRRHGCVACGAWSRNGIRRAAS